MSKKVLVISTSLHVKSNSEALADAFLMGATEAGHEVEKISLKGKEIHFCRGCLACHTLKTCAIKDDMIPIIQQMHDAEVIAFADMKECGTMAAAKAKGLVRSEGKEYVMKDGDIVNFLFNV